jgi:hypothetical protein
VSVTGFSLVAGFTAVQFWPLTAYDHGMTLLLKFTGIAAVTLTTHLVISTIFDLDEVRPLFAWVKRMTLRTVKIEY